MIKLELSYLLCCCSINRLSTENVRELLNLIKQSDNEIPLTAEDIAEKYNAKIVFRPGEFAFYLIIAFHFNAN